MKVRPYAPQVVPPKEYEAITLAFLIPIAGLFILTAAAVLYMGANPINIFQAVVFYSVLAMVPLAVWKILRVRRLRAEKCKADFYEAIRNG